MISLKTLRKRYPLHVIFTKPGHYHMLLWWTEREQHHILVAHSFQQMLTMWSIACKKWTEAKLEAYYVGNLVAPTQAQIDQFARDAYANDLENYKSHLSFDIQGYVDQYQKLPPNISTCTTFTPFESDWDPEVKEDHYYCQNCLGGFVLQGLMLEEIYEKEIKRQSRRDRRNRKKPYLQPGNTTFKGVPTPLPLFPVFEVSLNGGPHSPGVVVQTLTRLSSKPILFFFQGSSLPLPEEILKIEEQKKAANALWAQREQKHREKLSTKRKKAQFDDLLRLLKK